MNTIQSSFVQLCILSAHMVKKMSRDKVKVTKHKRKQKLQQLHAWFNLLATVHSVRLSTAREIEAFDNFNLLPILQSRAIKKVMTVNEKS